MSYGPQQILPPAPLSNLKAALRESAQANPAPVPDVIAYKGPQHDLVLSIADAAKRVAEQARRGRVDVRVA
ncbi:MAG TPA: hypothetical protein VN238_00090 [Solirubrobacteraceae bacterium]|nr:hypothetical protein [Solirubrobacteraceae bacterium]